MPMLSSRFQWAVVKFHNTKNSKDIEPNIFQYEKANFILQEEVCNILIVKGKIKVFYKT